MFRLPMLRVCILGLAVAAGLSVGAPANAAVQFDFVTGTGNYNVDPASTVTVQVFLRETLTGSSLSTLLEQDGLFSGVARVSRTTSPSSPAILTAAVRDATNFPDFDSSQVLVGNATADVGGARFVAVNGTPLITDSPTVRRVFLGTVTVQGGTVPSEVSTFTVTDKPNSSDTLLFTDGTELDALIGQNTFTVTVVPEPATVAGLGFVASGGLFLRRRRASVARV